MNEIANFITNVGFPVSLAVGLLCMFYKLGNIVLTKIITAFDRITEANDKITEANSELVRTNSILVSKIEGKIDLVIKKLDDKEVM